MTQARRTIVTQNANNWYHIINRCVRRAHLCGDDYEHRKEILRKRLCLLSSVFCVEIASYAIMDNHLHIVMLHKPLEAHTLSDEDVARRWAQAFPRTWDWTDDATTPEMDELRIADALKKTTDHCRMAQATWRYGLVPQGTQRTICTALQQRRQLQRHILGKSL